MIEEIWKDVVGYEGLYQVSNLGRVKSLDRYTVRRYKGGKTHEQLYKGILLKNIIDSDGYFIVSLRKNKTAKLKKVHRLVCEAFISNPENKPQVNHIDGNKQNNKLDNLEYCNASENQIHSIKFLGYRQSKETIEKRAKKQCKKVLCVELNKMFDSAKEASLWLGLNDHAITHYINGQGKTCGGYTWRYVK